MMYARAELDAAHQRFWQLMRQQLRLIGIDSPARLSQHSEEFSVWLHPQLLLSQTCGMPYRLWLHDKVQLVGTPDYALDHCPAGYYRSALVVRADDPRCTLGQFSESVFAYNQRFSQSGYCAAYWHVQASGFWFKRLLHTQQHLLSARAVADSSADIASIDAVSWRLISRYESFANKLRVLDWTSATPGLPLISANPDTDAIFSAVSQAIELLSCADREALGIRGIVKIDKQRYLEMDDPPDTPADFPDSSFSE